LYKRIETDALKRQQNDELAYDPCHLCRLTSTCTSLHTADSLTNSLCSADTQSHSCFLRHQ